MLAQKSDFNAESSKVETLDSFIHKEENYSISHKARYTGFRHRSKVEFLKFFIV